MRNLTQIDSNRLKPAPKETMIERSRSAIVGFIAIATAVALAIVLSFAAAEAFPFHWYSAKQPPQNQVLPKRLK